MITLLRLVTWQYLRQHPLRTCLTMLGVALGVAIFVAIRVTNLSTIRAFADTVDAVSGRTQLQVVGGIASLPQSLYPRLRAMPGLAAAVPVVTGYAAVEPWEEELLLVLGIDVFIDPAVRDYRLTTGTDDDREALQQLLDPTTLFLSEAFARRQGLTLGSTVSLLTPSGRGTYVIRGLLAAAGPAMALGGNFIVMEINAAQRAFQKVGVLDRIDLSLHPGIAVETMQEALQSRLGPGVKVERPTSRNAAVEKMLRSFQVNLTALSMIALFVGMFLIYNTLSSAVVERRRDIAILRAVGAGRGAIASVFLVEGLVLGVVGTLVGMPLGLLLSRLTLHIISQTLVSLYLVLAIQHLVISPGIIAAAAGIGLGASLVSVAIPIRDAVRVPPVEGMSLARYQQRPRRSLRRLLAPALLCLGLGYGLTWLQPVGDLPLFGYLAAFALLCGFSLLMPAVILGLTTCIRPLMFRLFRAEGQVAAENLQSALSRSAVAAASLMTGVAMVVSVTIMIASFKRTVYTWVDQTVQADLIVSAADPSSGVFAVPLPATLAEELRGLDGVLEVDALRSRSIPYGDRQVMLNVADVDVFARHTEYPFLEGQRDVSFREVIEQDSVIVSENFRYRFGVQRGDRLTLPTSEGPRDFRVAGVSIDYSSDQGTIVMHWGIFRKYWSEQVVDTIGIYLKPGANPEAVATEIKQRFGRLHRLFIFSNHTFKEEIYQLIKQSFVITYALEIIAIAVGLMGITTALYTSVLARQRETSVLRALGAFRQQIRKIIMLESALMGLLGLGVGTACGVCLSLILVYIINYQAFGWTLRLTFPAWTLLVDLSLIFLTALAAGLWPAHQASTAGLSETLRME